MSKQSEKKKSPNSAKICLKGLAPRTMEVLRELGTTSSEDTATIIINKLMATNPELTGQDTIRRRIYDVINVLSASGIIDKVGKQITWHGYKPIIERRLANPEGSNPLEKRIAAKEAKLRDNIHYLILYKVLISRNLKLEKPENAINGTHQVIFFGLDKNPELSTIKHPFDNKTLEIKSKAKLMVKSPLDLLRIIGKENKNLVSRLINTSPELSIYGSDLLNDDSSKV